VDVHAHLTHEKFQGSEELVHQKCAQVGVEYVILNGLEPVSNRQVLALSEKFPRYLPALGVYPLDAAAAVVRQHWEGIEFPPPDVFDVDQELEFIEQMAVEKRLVALGECGLDRHYVREEEVMREQERVLRRLMGIAKQHDLPIILHSRKAEARVFEMLQDEGVEKALFHCFMGKVKLGKRISTAGYSLSIPPAIARIESFRHLVKAVPLTSLLTETDSPYMGAEKATTNDPSEVCKVIGHIADVKGLPEEEVAAQIRQNCRKLFRI
jgi:TatD DNase family protein